MTVTISGSQTPSVGDSVVFTCDVTDANPSSVTRRWFVDGNEQAGETGDTFTLASTARGDDGSEVSCEADNGETGGSSLIVSLQCE